MNADGIDTFLRLLATWAQRRPDIRAVGLAGSHATGQARPDSDVDLVILTTDPACYTRDTGWLESFGRAERVAVEDWGAIQSVRAFFDGGPEVEFGFGLPSWASVTPVDAGTHQVVTGGFRVLADPDGLLATILDAVAP